MAKKRYQFLVTRDDGAASPSEGGAAAPAGPSVSEIAAQVPAEMPLSDDLSGTPTFDEIYQAARIAPPSHGYSILKVADMLRSEHIASLPADVKRKSVLLALDAAGVPIADIIEDAVRRDRALDTFERTQQKALEALEARVHADSARLRKKSRSSSPKGRLKSEPRTTSWRRKPPPSGHGASASAPKRRGSRKPSDISSPRTRSRSSRRLTRRRRSSATRGPKGTEAMFERFSRMVKSWMGFFISVGEDPEVMLQEAIEEMRSTMPRLNQVLVATRATVIRLEDEKNRLERDEKDVIASIKAALQDGSATARSIAEDDAVQLQQLRTELTATREQLLAAQKAYDGSKMSVEALKTKLQTKISGDSARRQRAAEGAWSCARRAEAIAELQSYGVASTADKFLEQIKQEVAESQAAVETAVGTLDTASIEKERMARKLKASSILAEFEAEMGIRRPAAVPQTPANAPTVGARVEEKQGT